MPNSVTYLNKTPIFDWCVIRCGSKNGHQKKQMFKRDWTTCSIFVNHSRNNSQHNLGDLLGSFMVLAVLPLRNHSSRKLHILLLNSQITVADQRKILTLEIQVENRGK